MKFIMFLSNSLIKDMAQEYMVRLYTSIEATEDLNIWILPAKLRRETFHLANLEINLSIRGLRVLALGLPLKMGTPK